MLRKFSTLQTIPTTRTVKGSTVGRKISTCVFVLGALSCVRSEKQGRRLFVLNDVNDIIEKNTMKFFSYNYLLAPPWTDIVSIPKTMMDGTAPLYGKITSHDEEEHLDVKYKVNNPSMYYNNYSPYQQYKTVVLKNSILGEFISLHGHIEDGNEDLTRQMLTGLGKYSRIMKSRMSRLRDMKENGVMDKIDYKEHITEQYKIESVFLNPGYFIDGGEIVHGLSESVTLIPNKHNIEMWFEKKLNEKPLTPENVEEYCKGYEIDMIEVIIESDYGHSTNKLCTVKYYDEIRSQQYLSNIVVYNIEKLRKELKDKGYHSNVGWYYYMPDFNLDEFEEVKKEDKQLIVDSKTEKEYLEKYSNSNGWTSYLYYWLMSKK